MGRLNLERNMRAYIGHTKGIPLTDIASFERISTQRVYQIITATEYQLSKGNPVYWKEYKSQTGTYSKI